MTPANQAKLARRIAKVAQHALSTRQFVTAIDVVVGIGWLQASQVEAPRTRALPGTGRHRQPI